MSQKEIYLHVWFFDYLKIHWEDISPETSLFFLLYYMTKVREHQCELQPHELQRPDSLMLVFFTNF